MAGFDQDRLFAGTVGVKGYRMHRITQTVRTLQANLEVYVRELPSLLPEHEGKYAMICGGQVYPYKTAELATATGLERCGNAHEFLVLKIEPPPSDSKMQRLGNISPVMRRKA